MGDIDMIGDLTKQLCAELADLADDERIDALNLVRAALHDISPMRSEPIDLVLWVPAEDVAANDYNPNRVAAAEMALLEHSIRMDGYTQPIVTYVEATAARTVIDGFHRNRVGREVLDLSARLRGRLPVTTLAPERTDRSDCMASTIRHNRARGKHVVAAMSDIVIDLTKRNWTENRIAKELGMDADEVLRLQQIGGLAELFADRDFSEAWEAP